MRVGPFREMDRAEALEVAGEAWRRLRALMRNTPGIAALSLLLAIVLWYFVTDTENPTLIDVYPSPVSVEPVNVTEALAVANQLPAVQVRISAPADRWERLTPANFKAVVDLNGFGARSQEVPVRVEVEGVRGVRVVDVQPRTIMVNLEDLATRQVSVTARAVGSTPLGYQIGAVTPQTPSARVSGPESLVVLIDQAVADVNVTGLTVNVRQNVVLKAVGTGGAEIRGVRIEPTNVPVNVEVIQTTIVRTVPLAVDVAGEPDPGYAVSRVASSPSAIQVQGPIEVLQQIDRIRLPAVSVAGARSDVVRSVPIPLPAGLSYVDRDRATVTVTVTPSSGSRRTTLAVEVLNVAPGRVGRVQGSGVVDVVLDGPLPVLNAMLSGELRATADAGGASAGRIILTVNVKAPDGVTVRSVLPASVEVTISVP
ncbi:MAG: hypothetical protein EPO16_06300 [Dehalococcoidia bacterium]|nr:MAG: hypothetical protein EPO16_06300 [Dehalococcoidia bacterium]